MVMLLKNTMELLALKSATQGTMLLAMVPVAQ